MEILIKFFSTLRNATGQDQVTITLPSNTTFKECLEKIQTDYFTSDNTKILKSNGLDLEVGVICLINDVDVSLMGGLKSKIRENQEITLISSLHGG